MVRNFLLTRESDKNRVDIETRFKDLSVNFISIPLIEIIYDFKWTEKRLKELESFTWIFFTSQGAINAFFSTLEKHIKNYDIEKNIEEILKYKKFAVVGKYTKFTLENLGYNANFMPTKASSKTLISEWEEEYSIDEEKLWIVGDIKKSEFLFKNTKYWKMYKNQCPYGNTYKLKKYMEENIITDYFVSSPSIWNRFFNILKEFPNYPPIHYYVIGSTTYNAIRKDLGKEAFVEIL